MSQKSIFTWPTRTERQFIEHKGQFEDVEVPDVPQITETVFNESKGIYEEQTRNMTDAEIVENGLVPDAAKKPAKKKAKKKPAKKKAKKKTSK